MPRELLTILEIATLLIGLALTVWKPVMRLNASITRFAVRVDHLSEKIEQEAHRNQDSWGRIHKRLDIQHKKLEKLNLKIHMVDKEVKREKY